MKQQIKTEKLSLNISHLISKNEVKLAKNISIAQLIETYLETKSGGWSLSTQQSEASRLRFLIPILTAHGLNPSKVYNELQKTMQPYTIKTVFIRLKSLIDFGLKYQLLQGALNQFEEYMTIIAPSKFKTVNVYKSKQISMNFDQILETFTNIEQTDIALYNTVVFLLKTGLRISELYKIEKDNQNNYYVKGKGGKLRYVLVTPPQELASVSKVRSALNKFNLKPHDLRKVCATHLINQKSISINELQQIFGWSDLNTANKYIQTTSNMVLSNKINEIIK